MPARHAAERGAEDRPRGARELVDHPGLLRDLEQSQPQRHHPDEPEGQSHRVPGAVQRARADRLDVPAHGGGDERADEQQDEHEVHRARAWHENATPTICRPMCELSWRLLSLTLPPLHVTCAASVRVERERMRRLSALAAVCLLLPCAVLAQTSSAPRSRAAKEKPKATNPSAGTAAQPTTSAKTGESGSAAAPENPATSTTASSGAGPTTAASQGGASSETASQKPPAASQIDPEEFRRQVMEEVRRELQKTKDEVKQQTSWIEQDSAARVQDSEAVEALRQRVNLFQPHGYLRLRGEFLNNLDLGRGTDQTGHTLFPGPYIGTGGNHSQSDANLRFRFEPTFEVSEDLSVYVQMDLLDNVLLGSNPKSDPFLDPFTPLHVLETTRVADVVKLKRVWGRVNTQLGELLFGRMGYHWGLGILHNDGNCLDCDFGDTYDRIAFTPREFKGHHLSVMLDLLDKGAITTGEKGELGRSVDVDTLDDGYRLALEVTRLDTPEGVNGKLVPGQCVFNYGLLLDYRTQGWDTVVTTNLDNVTTLGQFFSLRGNVIK